MFRNNLISVIFFMIFAGINCTSAEIKVIENKKINNSDKEQIRMDSNSKSDKRMEWWRNARFGIFVHWGVYSMLGGEYKGRDYGKEMGGPSIEWIYKTAGIPKEQYREFASEWNPENYNPEQWCRIAADAGAGYIVLTAKHHDGLALFDSDIDDWNIMQATAYKKDIVQQFVDAARKYKLKVGLYYSHRFDWYRLGTSRNVKLTDSYKRVLEAHLKTLCEKYHPDLIWFDMGKPGPIADTAFKITKQFAPDCVICGRIGGDYGDYKCMKDRHLPPPGNKGDAETPMTMRLNWGFDKDDENWKSPDDIIKMLSICAARNTNLLLNIGPDGDGRITDNEISILHSVGAWMKINKEAICNTSGTPFKGEFSWGSLTVGNDRKNFYIHIHNKPDGAAVIIPGVLTNVSGAVLLDSGKGIPCGFTQKDKKLTIHLPDTKQSEPVEIIKVTAGQPFLFDSSAGPGPGQEILNMPDTRIISARSGVIEKFSDENNGTLTVKRDSGVIFTVKNINNAAVLYADGKRGSIDELVPGTAVKTVVEFTKRKRPATFRTEVIIKKALPR